MREIHSESVALSAYGEFAQSRNNDRSIEAVLHQLATDCHEHSGQPFEIVQFLCREIVRITHEHAQLVLESQTRTIEGDVIPFPVKCKHHQFGTLLWSAQASASDAQEIARTCGCILCHVAALALINTQSAERTPMKDNTLTPREREVLECLRHHQSQQEIAKTLDIHLRTVQKHRENIFDKLHVNHEVSVSIAAYHAHIYSPLERQAGEPRTRGQDGAAGAQ